MQYVKFEDALAWNRLDLWGEKMPKEQENFGTVKYCAQCRAGENRVEADYLVHGSIWSKGGDGPMIPYKAYICIDHFDMLNDDGAELDIIKRLTRKAKTEALDYWHTMYTNARARRDCHVVGSWQYDEEMKDYLRAHKRYCNLQDELGLND